MDFKSKYSLKEGSGQGGAAIESLKDFDWSTSVVVSTSSVASVDIPLFQLCLRLSGQDGASSDRDVVLELTVDELRSWLQELMPIQNAFTEMS